MTFFAYLPLVTAAWSFEPLKELHFKLHVRTALLIMCGKVVDEGLPLASGIRYGEASRPHRVFGNYQKSTYYAAYALTPPTHILQINPKLLMRRY